MRRVEKCLTFSKGRYYVFMGAIIEFNTLRLQKYYILFESLVMRYFKEIIFVLKRAKLVLANHISNLLKNVYNSLSTRIA